MSSVAAAYMLAAEQKRRSTFKTPSPSFESERSATYEPVPVAKESGSLKRAVKKIVKAAKDHHKSVNTAFDTYYRTKIYAERE